MQMLSAHERRTLIEAAVLDAMVERWGAMQDSSLDSFKDVVWPSVYRELAQTLGVEVAIDDTKYEDWDWRQ